MVQQFFQLQNSFPPILELKGLSCVEEVNTLVNAFFFFFFCSCHFPGGEAVYNGEKIIILFKHRLGSGLEATVYYLIALI